MHMRQAGVRVTHTSASCIAWGAVALPAGRRLVERVREALPSTSSSATGHLAGRRCIGRRNRGTNPCARAAWGLRGNRPLLKSKSWRRKNYFDRSQTSERSVKLMTRSLSSSSLSLIKKQRYALLLLVYCALHQSHKLNNNVVDDPSWTGACMLGRTGGS